MNKMKEVPVDIITGKDLDYLSDMFQWNYISLKKTCNDIEYINNQKISEIFGEASDLFEKNLGIILDIINNPGGDFCE